MVMLMGGLTNIGDVLNAGNVMRDRGKYLRSGSFTWLPSGNNGFTGTVVGYAPYSGNDDYIEGGEAFNGGSIGVDGGTAWRVHGSGPIAVNRWSAGSTQVNGGIAWGVSYPAGGSIPSGYEMSRAMDRLHKDGAMVQVTHDFDYGSMNEGFLGSGLTIVNQGGPGALITANLWQKMNSWSSGQAMQSVLDFYIDSTYRFSMVNGWRQEYSQSSNDKGWRGVTGSMGFIPFASNLTINLRRKADNGFRIEASVGMLLGTLT